MLPNIPLVAPVVKMGLLLRGIIGDAQKKQNDGKNATGTWVFLIVDPPFSR